MIKEGLITGNYDFSVLRKLRKAQEWTIAQLSETSSVSSAVISRLERNQGSPELDTLFRLGKALGMTATDLISLAEFRSSQKVEAVKYHSGSFDFESINYLNAKCHFGEAKASGKLSRPEVHKDEYEICWVLEGQVDITVSDEHHNLTKGEALQFDAILPHSYRVIEDCKVFIIHLHKEKRF
jgi:transcriptional regulator with XRE-family HTH domain